MATGTNVDGKSVDQLAREVIDGRYGDDTETRKALLGATYENVMARVQEILLGTSAQQTGTAPQNKAMEATSRVNKALFSDSRIEEFGVRVLDKKNNVVGSLDGVVGGTITGSVDARIKTAGKLEIKTDRPVEWWGDRRLQPWVRVNGIEWSLGVFIPESPTRNYHAYGVDFTVDIYDLLTVLDEDCVPNTYSIPAGTRLTPVIEQLIKSANEWNYAITPSSKTNYRSLTWEAGTSKLTIINDILDFIEYFSLTCNADGQYTASPYVVPRDRPVAWRLFEGTNAVHSADFTYTHDLYSVPNRVVYLVQTAGTGVPGIPASFDLRACYENHDPTSMFSYERRGRWVTQVKTDAEAETQAELDEKVRKRIERAQSPMEKVEITNAVLPLKLNEVVYFRSQGIDMPTTVRKWEVTMTPGALMKTTLRRANISDTAFNEEFDEDNMGE